MKPLEAYRIVELGLGPVTGLAGMVLADFGAEVIKIDPLAGDRFDAMPASRLWRRGKQTVTAALAQPEAVARVHCPAPAAMTRPHHSDAAPSATEFLLALAKAPTASVLRQLRHAHGAMLAAGPAAELAATSQ